MNAILRLFDKKLLRFILVGLFNTLMGAVTMFGFYNLLRMGYWGSSALSYFLCSVISFFLNQLYLWRQRRLWSGGPEIRGEYRDLLRPGLFGGKAADPLYSGGAGEGSARHCPGAGRTIRHVGGHGVLYRPELSGPAIFRFSR